MTTPSATTTWISLALFTVLATASCGGVEGEFLDGLNVEDETSFALGFSDVGVSLWTGNGNLAGKHFLSHADANTLTNQPASAESEAVLESLQEHGYISSEPVEINQNWSGAMIGYELTAMGREHFKPGENVVVGTRRATEVSDYIDHGGGARWWK